MPLHPYLALPIIASISLFSCNENTPSAEQLKQEWINQEEDVSLESEFATEREELDVQQIRELQAVLQKLHTPDAQFSKSEIDQLIYIALNPEIKDEYNNYIFYSYQGPKKVAQDVAAILGQEAAHNKWCYDRVFTLFSKDAVKLDKMILEPFLDRLIRVHPTGLNTKLNTLIKELDLSNSKAQNVVKLVFEYKLNLINAKTGKKDLELTVPIFCNADIKDDLRLTIHYYILQIFHDSMLSDAEIKKIGDEIFSRVKGNEKLAKSPYICKVLGSSGSDSALEFYKGKMSKKDDWKVYKSFFEEWRNPDIIPYLVDLRDSCSADEAKQAGTINSIIFGIALAERDMPVDEARKLIRIIYPDYDTDITPLYELECKRYEEGRLFGDDQETWLTLSAVLIHKINVIKQISNYSEEYEWVTAVLADEKDYCNSIDISKWTDRLKDLNSFINKAPDKIKANKAEKARR